MEDQNIGVLYQTLTGICDVVETLEQKMHHLSQNGAAHLIRGSLNDAPRVDFKVQLSTLTEKFSGLRHFMEGSGFNKVVGYFKSLTDFTIWVRDNLPSDTPKPDYFIYLYILLAEVL